MYDEYCSWEDFCPGYLLDIKERLEEEISNQVDKKTNQYNEAISNYHGMHTQILTLQSALSATTAEYERKIKSLNEEISQLKQKNTKESLSSIIFDLDKVKTKYYISEEPKEYKSYKCPCCTDGHITKEIDGEKFKKDCSVCGGEGRIFLKRFVVDNTSSNKYMVQFDNKTNVPSITLEIGWYSPIYVKIEKIYTDKEFAEEECARLNDTRIESKIKELNKKTKDYTFTKEFFK